MKSIWWREYINLWNEITAWTNTKKRRIKQEKSSIFISKCLLFVSKKNLPSKFKKRKILPIKTKTYFQKKHNELQLTVVDK